MRPVVVAVLVRWLGPWAGWLVPTYPIMLGLGCLLAAVLLVENARKLGYTRQQTLGVVIMAYSLGLLGANLVPLVQGLIVLVQTGAFKPPSGIAAYGGLIGGVAAAVWWLRRSRLPVLPFLDALAPSVGLGYFFARLGCLLAGCDYGSTTQLALAVRFPAGSHAHRDHVAHGLIDAGAPWSLPVHPTQIYMALAGLLLFLATSLLPARGDGRRFLAYVVGYAALRSLIELLRGDAGRGFLGPLSTSQALALVSVGLTVALVRREQRATQAAA